MTWIALRAVGTVAARALIPPVPNCHSFSYLGQQTTLKLSVYFQHGQAGQEDQIKERVALFHLSWAGVKPKLLQWLIQLPS